MIRRRLALFDLDNTLLTGDTDVLWCDFLIECGRLDGATFAAGAEPARAVVRGWGGNGNGCGSQSVSP